jgi:hypothetical protein
VAGKSKNFNLGGDKMFRVGLIRANGIPEAHNFDTKGEAESWLLALMDKEPNLRQARLKNLDTGEEEKII